MIRPRLISAILLIAAGIPGCTDTPVPARPAIIPQAGQATARPTPAQPPHGTVTRMPIGTLFELQQSGNALIYDVRPAFTRALGSIPGSVSWPKNAYESQLASRETEIRAAATAGKAVVFYCTDLACPDATTVATRLAARGHKTSVLQGGWDAWKTAGLPTQ